MKKLILLILCMILLVGTASAFFEFDNVKSYDKETKTIKIKNVFGLGSDIADIQLLSEPHRRIIPTEYAFEMKFNLPKSYPKAVKNIKFYQKHNMDLIDNPNFILKYYDPELTYKDTIYDYKDDCSILDEFGRCKRVFIGTHKETMQGQWVELNSLGDLPKGEIIIRGYYPDLKEGEIIEWIPELFGVKVTEWADFGTATRYEYLTAAVGDKIYHTATSPIGQGFQVGVVGANAMHSVTGVSLHLYRLGDAQGESVITIQYSNDTGYPNGTFVASGITDNAKTMTTDEGGAWYNYSISTIIPLQTNQRYSIGLHLTSTTDTSNRLGWVVDNTGGGRYSDTTNAAMSSNPGNNTWKYLFVAGTYDGNFEVWGITNPPPTSTLNAPDDLATVTNPNIVFNATGTDDTTLQNMSLIVNGSYISTNSSVFDSTLTQFPYTLPSASYYNWTVEACDNLNSCVNATLRGITYTNDLAVSLDLPNNDDNFYTLTNDFNCTAKDDTTITNLTLIINGTEQAGTSNSSVYNNTLTNFQYTAGTIGFFNWSCIVYDAVSSVTATYRNFTISSNIAVSLNSPINAFNSTSQTIRFNGTGQDDTTVANVSFILNATYNGTNSSVFNATLTNFDRTLADGFYNWTLEACDDIGICVNATARNFTIDTTLPVINIIYPTNTTYWTNYTTIDNVTTRLNWTTTDTNLDSCWYYNTTDNVSLTCGDNVTLIYFSHTLHTFIIYANDTSGNEISASITATWDYKFFENYEIYDNNTNQMSSETFSINVSSDGSEIILGYLVYNGTSYLATKVGNDVLMEFNKTLSLPTVGNISFYWSFNYGGEMINSSTFYQTVNATTMSYCTGGANMIFNFTAYNEENLARIKPYDFFGTFVYWIGDGSLTNNFSISNASVDDVVICVNTNLTYYTNAKIQYENTSFVKRNYYLINESNSSSSQNISLFLLNTSSSTSFIIEVKDEVQISIPDAYVYIQRYYTGTDQYHTIEMALTDNTGSTIGHFEAETEDYRLIFEKDGIIIYQSGTQKIFCRETPCTITFQTVAGAGLTWEDFGVIDNFDWALDYDETTEVWTLIYTDTSGEIGYGRLYVYLEDPVEGETLICNTSSSLLADTLTCDVTGYNGTIYASAYLSRSPEILISLKSIFQKIAAGIREVLGLEGLFLSMFVLLSLALTGLWNPAVGVILVVVGMLVLNIMGLASFGMTTLWSVIFIALILLWKLKT